MTECPESFEIPETLPIVPLRGMVVFPHMVLPIYVTRERSIAAIDDAMAGASDLVGAARAHAVPIVFFQEAHRRDLVDFGRELDGAEDSDGGV